MGTARWSEPFLEKHPDVKAAMKKLPKFNDSGEIVLAKEEFYELVAYVAEVEDMIKDSSLLPKDEVNELLELKDKINTKLKKLCNEISQF